MGPAYFSLKKITAVENLFIIFSWSWHCLACKSNIDQIRVKSDKGDLKSASQYKMFLLDKLFIWKLQSSTFVGYLIFLKRIVDINFHW